MQDEDYMDRIYQYLATYQRVYDYTTVFCVSAQTGNYYYQEGLNKILQPEDEHDIWYYNFLDKDQEYDVQIDSDQVNGNVPTIFINYRLEDTTGKLLGVVGVAIELRDIQTVIAKYESTYDLSIYLINPGGPVNSFAQETEHFVELAQVEKKLGLTQEFATRQDEDGEMIWNTGERDITCIVNAYCPELKWNLITVKNTDSL